MIDSAFVAKFKEAESCLQALLSDAQTMAALVRIAEKLRDLFLNGGKVLAAGNGGSMADAMHFAEEWTGRFRDDRRPYPAMAISDPTHLTCVGNDYGYDKVFSRTVQAFSKPGDMVLLLSTSGNSENLVLAAEAARNAGATVVGFLGRGGGRLAPLCDEVVMAPGQTSDRIQEIHMLCLHVLIDLVEQELPKE